MSFTFLRRQDKSDSLLPDLLKEFVCSSLPGNKKKATTKSLISTYRMMNQEQRYRFEQVMRLFFSRLETVMHEKSPWVPGLPIQESIQITARFSMLSDEMEKAIKLSLLAYAWRLQEDRRSKRRRSAGHRGWRADTIPNEIVVLHSLYEEDDDYWDTDNRISQFKNADYEFVMSKLDKQQRQELGLWVTVLTEPPSSRLMNTARKLIS